MNNKKGSGAIILLGMVIVVVIIGVIYYLVATHLSPLGSQSGVNNDYAITVATDTKSIAITNNGAVVKEITLNEIQSFDNNDDGTPADPSVDYLFNDVTAFDTSTQTVYFSVSNATTAGNVNADEALFSYDINAKKLTLLINEGFSASFGDLEISPDGRTLVYDDGDHGGWCFTTTGLEIYSIQDQTTTASLFGKTYGLDNIYFDHWVSSSSFAYNEEEYPSLASCLADTSGDIPTFQKTYTIK